MATNVKLELTLAQVELVQEALNHYADHLRKSRIEVLNREMENLRMYMERAKRG